MTHIEEKPIEDTQTVVVNEPIEKKDDSERDSNETLISKSKVLFKKVIKATLLKAVQIVVGSDNRIVITQDGIIEVYNADNRKIAVGTGFFGNGIIAFFDNSGNTAGSLFQVPGGVKVQGVLGDTVTELIVAVDPTTGERKVAASNTTLGDPSIGWKRLILQDTDKLQNHAILVDSAGTLTTSQL